MAKVNKATNEEVTVVPVKDFDRAVKIYREDIKPASSKAADHMQEASTGFKTIKKHCHIQPSSVKVANRQFLDAEEAMGDDWMRGFVGYVNKAAGRIVLTFHGNDLVDMAEGKTPTPGRKPKLVTVPLPSDGSETDLAGE